MGRRTLAAACALVALSVSSAAAQGDTFKARLSRTPVENANAALVTGSGSATATLGGRTLMVRGSFEGMKSAATIAQIHLGPKGVRGPAIFDLTVAKGPATGAGTIAGTFLLTPEQVEALRQSRFYIQIHSESVPDGNLWGWLVPSEPGAAGGAGGPGGAAGK